MKQSLAIQPLKWITESLFARAALCLVGGILLLSGSSQGSFIAGDLSGDCRVDFENLGLATSQWVQASCDAETGLIAHWKLNESSGSTAVDSSASGYNGIVAGVSWNPAIIGMTSYSCPDLNADEIVNFNDFAELSQNWEDETPPILINEFMADNESRSPLEPGEILDGNYESSDWIELHNNSEMVIDISDWYLTDESNLKTKWQFPSGMGQLVLQPGDFLIVFASGKTQAQNPGNYPYEDPAGYLHTNFQLSKSGEYLALIHADGTTPIHEYNHFEQGGNEYGYPDQEENISYGYYYDETRYFSEPTPGTDNVKASFEEFVEKPDVNIKGGCYVNGFDLTMSCGTPDAFIQYTTDGTVPSLINGTLYTGPIHIDSLTTIIAKAFKPGLQHSDTRIETYIFVQSAVAAFNSNLPILVIDTLGTTIPNDPTNKPYIDCRAVIIDIDDVTGRADITGPEHFAGLGQIRRRGESTYGQGHYAFEVQDEYGQDKDVSLLGMPADSDWIINYEVIDYTLLKCEIAFKWFRDMGHYAPRQRYVDVYFNTGGGKISTGDYKGIYILREKIKRNDDRVDIARLDASHNLEPKISGGYIIKSDKEDDGVTYLADGPGGHEDYLETGAPYNIHTTGNAKTILVEPRHLEVTAPQIDWIADYINEFHAVLWQNESSSYYPGPGPDYTDYVEVISWIDHGIVEQIGADSDAFWGSYFTHKDRDGKICSGPVWDFDRSFHNSGGSSSGYTVWKSNDAIFGKWHQKLQQYPEYKMMLADRWFEHREVVLNTALTMAYIDETVALMTEAMDRTHGISGRFPRPFADEIVLFKNWTTNRLDFMDREIARRFAERPPVFSPLGGYVNQGDPLYISKPSGASGTIYYTLNGEDPRLEGGGINSNAEIYSDPGGPTTKSIVDMSSSSWKYLYDGTDQGTAWRAYGFNDNSWVSGPGQLGFGDGDEDTNIGPKVNGRYTAYFRHKFSVSDVSEITALSINLIYDDGAVIYINGKELPRVNMNMGTVYYDTKSDGSDGDNASVTLTGIEPAILNEGSGNILAVEVHQQSSTSTDLSFDLGLYASRPPSGLSQIEFDKSTCVRARVRDGGDWSAQNKEVYAVGPILENLRITELMFHPESTGDPNDPNEEYIELKNRSGWPINLNLVRFTNGIEFTFPSVELEADEYILVVKDIEAFAAQYGIGYKIAGQYSGSLNNAGERIELEDAAGQTIHNFRYRDDWYDITDGMGFSLTIKDPTVTDPNEWDSKSGWRPSADIGGSPGWDDTGDVPGFGDVVINEILAHSHAGAPDWIELHNTTDASINIGGWFLSDSSTNFMKYEIAAGTTIEPNGYIVFYEDLHFGSPAADSNPGCHVPFALSENDETLYLHSGQDGVLTGYSEEEKFDASETGIAFGRYLKSTGTYNFVAMSQNTPGSANAYPQVGPLIINEIMYNPFSGNQDAEYIELLNISGSEVTLDEYDNEQLIDVPWRLTDSGGISFDFPLGTTMAAGEYLLLVKYKDVFNSQYPAVPTGTQIFEWGDGKLDNSGEKVQISMPGDVDIEG